MVSSTLAVPAIPHEELLLQLQQYCFSDRMVRMLQREPIFGELQYWSHQIYIVHDFALRNGNPELSPRQFSRAFGCSLTRVKAALDNGLNDPKLRGRHFAFDDDSEVEILDWIQRQAEKSALVTRTDLKHYCEATYSRSISRG
jgi:hypothetical protein